MGSPVHSRPFQPEHIYGNKIIIDNGEIDEEDREETPAPPLTAIVGTKLEANDKQPQQNADNINTDRSEIIDLSELTALKKNFLLRRGRNRYGD